MRPSSAMAAIVLIACVAGALQGALVTWHGSTDNFNWSAPSNWWGGEVPVAADDVNFYGGVETPLWGPSTVTLDVSPTITNLLVNGWNNGYTFNGSTTLSVTGNLTYLNQNANSTNGLTLNPVLNLSGRFLASREAQGGSNYFKLQAGGNFIGGGLDVRNHDVQFNGNNNTINGGIVVSGYCANSFAGTMGVVYFGGTGNIFGAGTFTLNRYGTMDFANAADLSNITAITFNGGTLRLRSTGNTFNPAITSWNVRDGNLIVGSAAILAVPVTLGGVGTSGCLSGGWSNSSSLTQPLTLAGNGWLNASYADFGGGSYLNVSSLISGPGRLVKTGESTVQLLGPIANTYSGGTSVLEGMLQLGYSTSMGSGNVTVAGNGRLMLYASGNVGSGANVLVQKGFGFYNGVLDLQANIIPAINAASDGVLAITTTASSSGPIAGSLAAAAPGDGKMYMSTYGSGTYGGTSLAAGPAETSGGRPTWRFGNLGQDSVYSLTISAGCLSGANDVLTRGAGVYVYVAQTFTGDIIARDSLQLGQYNSGWGYMGIGVSSGSPLGASTGNVKLLSGSLYYSGNGANGSVISKNTLRFDGAGRIGLAGPSSSHLTQLTFASLERVDKGTLIVGAVDSNGLGSGGRSKLICTSGVAKDATTTMVSPYIVAVDGSSGAFSSSPWNTGSFVTHDTTNGFTKLAFTTMPTSGGTGTAIARASSAATLAGDVNVWALRADAPITGSGTITLGSGGLILTGQFSSTDQTTANFRFGASGSAEAVLFANGTNSTNHNFSTNFPVKLAGQLITTGGLTKFGPGCLRLEGDNSSTLFGDITVNQGVLSITNDNQLGAAGNVVHLNGGALHAFPIGGPGVVLPETRSIRIGPNGGRIHNDYENGFDVFSTISDEGPGAGPLSFGGNTTILESPNTYSGGTIMYGGSLRLYTAGTLGTGPILVMPQSSIWNFRDRVLDQSSSALTIVGSSNSNRGTFGLATYGAKFGSLSGDGAIQMGDFWTNATDLTLTVGALASSDFYGTIYDIQRHSGTLVKEGNTTLTLWGELSYHGMTRVNAGTLRIHGTLGVGPVFVGNDVLVNSGGTLDGTGTIERNLNVQAGGSVIGSLMIKGNVATSGSFISSGSVSGNFAAAGGTVAGTFPITKSGGTVAISGGTAFGGSHTINVPAGQVLVDGDGTSVTGANSITGDLTIGLSGQPTFGGTGPIVGNVQLEGGTFGGTHTISGSVVLGNVNGGGDFTGTSTIAGDVQLHGGSLRGAHNVQGSLTTYSDWGGSGLSASDTGTPATMTVVGNLTLDPCVYMDYHLHAPPTVGGGVNDLISVGGNLMLDGTINVVALSGFGQGTYRLMNYSGTLTDSGLAIGATPDPGFTYTVQAGGGHVDLVIGTDGMPGDANRDGLVDAADIDTIYAHFGTGSAFVQWDVNHDGTVNQDDVTYELTSLAVGLQSDYGDANLDHNVNFTDFQTVLNHWQEIGAGWAEGDFTGDHEVNFTDFQKVLGNWNVAGLGHAAPEPSAALLLAAAALALARRR